MSIQLLDQFLILLMALTAGLIGWNALVLYAPQVLRRAAFGADIHSELELDESLEQLECGMPLLGTLAAVTPFLGLAATVVHIRTALTLVGGTTPDTHIIAGPIATALGSTLLGLASAIPAAAAYNLFARRLQVLENRVRRRLQRAEVSSRPSAPCAV